MSVWTTAGLIADGTFDDPANARVIYLAVAGLVLLAVLLGVGTWLWWRSSKVENPVLAPLEVMSSRRWWKSDFNERQRRLDAVRPVVVDGEHDDEDVEVAPVAEPVDLDHVLVRDDPDTFDDLVDPDAVAVPAEPAVAAEAAGDPVADVEPVADSAPAADAESVVDAEPSADAEPAVAVEAAAEVDQTAAQESAVVAAESEPTPEPAEAEPAMRSIVIDTAPKPRDTPSDLGPEAAPTEPAPAPIDPLLRLQAE